MRTHVCGLVRGMVVCGWYGGVRMVVCACVA